MRRLLNPELALGFLIATLLWIGVLGWQASYAPTDSEKRQCEETATKSGHKTEECKTLWERTTSDPVAFFTFWLVVFTGGLGVSTVMLWLAGEKQIELAREASTAQSAEMQASINEAVRAATAMEEVAAGIAVSAQAAQDSVATLKERTAIQMRAYLTVLIHQGVYQERDKGLKFEVKPMLINSGQTPAHKVTYRARAAVFPYPLPDSVTLDPPEDTLRSALVLGPQQNIIMNALVDTVFDDDVADDIKSGKKMRAYIWGTATYFDAFGVPHQTNFCHSVYWVVLPDGKFFVTGNYAARHNDAD
jgi:hypothetical protein